MNATRSHFQAIILSRCYVYNFLSTCRFTTRALFNFRIFTRKFQDIYSLCRNKSSATLSPTSTRVLQNTDTDLDRKAHVHHHRRLTSAPRHSTRTPTEELTKLEAADALTVFMVVMARALLLKTMTNVGRCGPPLWIGAPASTSSFIRAFSLGRRGRPRKTVLLH